MEWNSEEKENTKKGVSSSSKLLIGIIACVIVIIILLLLLLLNMEEETIFSINVDGKAVTTTKNELLTTIDNETYVNIEEFAKLTGYEYHKGEYKSYVAEENKCYVEGANETASFYLNDNKVYKLEVNKNEENYEEYEIGNTIKAINGKMYGPVDSIKKAFNVIIEESETNLSIYTLEYLVTTYDEKVMQWGYTSIANQSFENKKAILYGYLIVKKDGGLYKIIDTNNTKEIVLDRYNSIEFSENMQEFFVTNSSNQVGVINLDGTTKIETTYEEIFVLDKETDLYLIKKSEKYGVIKGANVTIIFPEYDAIGLTNTSISSNKYLLLDKLIPVYKEKKWGAYDKQGNLVLKVEYDEFGYNSNNIEINGIKTSVQPVLEIERANGIVVKQQGKYGLVNLSGEILVPIAVDGIYAINDAENEEEKYYMLYKENELNVIERLIKAGLLEDTNATDETTNTIQNNTENNMTNGTVNN